MINAKCFPVNQVGQPTAVSCPPDISIEPSSSPRQRRAWAWITAPWPWLNSPVLAASDLKLSSLWSRTPFDHVHSVSDLWRDYGWECSAGAFKWANVNSIETYEITSNHQLAPESSSKNRLLLFTVSCHQTRTPNNRNVLLSWVTQRQ